jgi:hypothetical protein
MGAPTQFSLFGLQVSVRFIQGYRYLDRCGECLIRLEDKLDEGWIPVETSPTSGTMKNETIGLTITFNSEGMNLRQAEYLEFDTFRDQSCKAYDILWRLLAIERISAPTLRVWYQMGFDEDREDDAEQYLLTMSLYQTDQRLLKAMGGARPVRCSR